MADPSTLELPQVFSRSAGPVQPVSVFQGYHPGELERVEGQYQGGFAPLMQDPITYAAMGPTMGLGQMFSQAAYQGLPQMVPQRAMPQPSVMSGYEPPTTRPGMVYMRGVPTPAMPKAYVNPSGRAESGYYSPEMAEHDLPTFYEWAQSSDPGKAEFARNAIRQIEAEQASPMVPLRGSPTTPLTSSYPGHQWKNVTGNLNDPMAHRRNIYGNITGAYGEELDSPPSMPTLPLEPGDYGYKEPTRPTGSLPPNIDWNASQRQRVLRDVQGGPTRIPVTREPYPMEEWMKRHGTPGMPTQPIGGVEQSPFGGKLYYGPSETMPLKNIGDLFKDLPE